MELLSLQFHLSSSAMAQLLIAGVWQGVVITLITAILLKQLLPSMSAARRFRIWMAALLLTALLPLTTLVSWKAALREAPSPLVGVSSAAHAPETFLTLSMYWSWGFLALWAGLTLFSCLRLSAGLLGIYQLLRSSVPVDLEGMPGREMMRGKRKNVQILAADSLSAPVATGFLCPVIILPRHLLQDFTHEEMRQVLRHEFEHLARWDDWTTLFMRAVRCLFPLSPALYYIEKQLCRERELACDDAVLHEKISPRGYALCLTRMAEMSMSRRSVSLVPSLLGESSQLTARVSHILGPQSSLQEMARFPLAVSLAAMALTASALLCCPRMVSFRALPAPPSLAQYRPAMPEPVLTQAKATMASAPRHAAVAHKILHHAAPKPVQLQSLATQQPLPAPDNVQITKMLVLWKAPASSPEQTFLLFVETTSRAGHSITIERQFFEI